MAPGIANMNSVTVQQASQGLCAYLLDVTRPQSASSDAQPQARAEILERGICIGYDGRHQSRDFAHLAAAVFVSRNVPVHMFSCLVPTPFVVCRMSRSLSNNQL
jgi:phosphomannomutase